jgi:precorrin-6B methylase 2
MVYPYEEKSENGLPWHTTFIGQFMQHNYWLYSVVDKIMLANPQIQSIVEIGTGNGALTIVLGLWGIKRHIPVWTIDRQKLYDHNLLSQLNVKILQADELEESTKDHILSVVNNKPTWIFCDGGWKMKEFATYAPLIPSDSIITAHDLGTEFSADLALEQLGPNIVEPYMKEYWNDLNIQLGIFKKL